MALRTRMWQYGAAASPLPCGERWARSAPGEGAHVPAHQVRPPHPNPLPTGEREQAAARGATITLRRPPMTPALDPVTLEVIRNALPAVANEMAADLQRTSYNMMIYEVRDYCTALLDTRGELISQNVGGVSHFVADLGVIVVDGMPRYGRDGFRPGDVIITNHQRGRRAAPQQHRHLHAVLPSRRAVDVLHACARTGSTSAGRAPASAPARRWPTLARRAPARPAQDRTRPAGSTRRSTA